jgi:hypothetical protein
MEQPTSTSPQMDSAYKAAAHTTAATHSAASVHQASSHTTSSSPTTAATSAPRNLPYEQV